MGKEEGMEKRKVANKMEEGMGKKIREEDVSMVCVHLVL